MSKDQDKILYDLAYKEILSLIQNNEGRKQKYATINELTEIKKQLKNIDGLFNNVINKNNSNNKSNQKLDEIIDLL